jgi:uncharacterized protein YutE (UPF0331/DUF86 family)
VSDETVYGIIRKDIQDIEEFIERFMKALNLGANK